MTYFKMQIKRAKEGRGQSAAPRCSVLPASPDVVGNF